MLRLALAVPILAVIVMIVGLIAHEWTSGAMIGVLLALASLVTGLLLGFLFGIPKALQNDHPESGLQRAYATNTNLEQISDWLTKILVGVGLVEMGKISARFGELTEEVGGTFAVGEYGQIFAGSLILLFVIWGFLVGYVATRTYLSLALREFDSMSSTEPKALVEVSRSLEHAHVDPAPEASPLRPPLGGAVPPSHNREPIDQPLVLPYLGPTFDMKAFRQQAINMLQQLVGPQPGHRTSSPDAMISLLANRGVLDDDVARSLRSLFASTGTGGWLHHMGPAKAEAVSASVEEFARATLQRLAELGRFGPVRFEEHVLSAVRSAAGARAWQVRSDLQVAMPSASAVLARVDAVVLEPAGNRCMVVEVRARLHRGDYAQIEGLRQWLEGLSIGVPIVLVVQNEGIDGQIIQETIARSGRDVVLFSWDDGSAGFASFLYGRGLAPLPPGFQILDFGGSSGWV